MDFGYERVIGAPPHQVFAFLSEPRNRPKWQRSLRRVEVLSRGETRLGTEWRETPFGIGTVAMRITEYDPPKRWAERGTSPLGRLDLTLTFEAVENRTRLRVDVQLETWPLVRFLARMGRPLMLREIRNDLAMAADILEHGNIPDPPRS